MNILKMNLELLIISLPLPKEKIKKEHISYALFSSNNLHN